MLEFFLRAREEAQLLGIGDSLELEGHCSIQQDVTLVTLWWLWHHQICCKAGNRGTDFTEQLLPSHSQLLCAHLLLSIGLICS